MSTNKSNRLKKGLRNILIFTVVGFGTYYGYKTYREHRWQKQMEESEQLMGMKPRVVVLGTGLIPYLMKEKLASNRRLIFVINSN